MRAHASGEHGLEGGVGDEPHRRRLGGANHDRAEPPKHGACAHSASPLVTWQATGQNMRRRRACDRDDDRSPCQRQPVRGAVDGAAVEVRATLHRRDGGQVALHKQHVRAGRGHGCQRDLPPIALRRRSEARCLSPTERLAEPTKLSGMQETSQYGSGSISPTHTRCAPRDVSAQRRRAARHAMKTHAARGRRSWRHLHARAGLARRKRNCRAEAHGALYRTRGRGVAPAALQPGHLDSELDHSALLHAQEVAAIAEKARGGPLRWARYKGPAGRPASREP
jgi:hypothetical protein